MASFLMVFYQFGGKLCRAYYAFFTDLEGGYPIDTHPVQLIFKVSGIWDQVNFKTGLVIICQ